MSQITQKGATGGLALVAGNQFQSSTDVNFATMVGTRWDLSDGREVILVSTTSTSNVTAGNLMQDAALLANHQNCTVTAFTTGANTLSTVTLTLGATALTASQYQGGFAVINDGAGIGQTLRIASNPAALSSGTGVVITLEDGANVALDTTSKVCLIPNHGAGVIVSPTTPTNVSCGIGLYNIPASSYGFIVSKGLVSAISDSKVATIGQGIAPSVTTAGTVTVALTNVTGASLIGTAAYTAVSAKAYPVYLEI